MQKVVLPMHSHILSRKPIKINKNREGLRAPITRCGHEVDVEEAIHNYKYMHDKPESKLSISWTCGSCQVTEHSMMKPGTIFNNLSPIYTTLDIIHVISVPRPSPFYHFPTSMYWMQTEEQSREGLGASLAYADMKLKCKLVVLFKVFSWTYTLHTFAGGRVAQ